MQTISFPAKDVTTEIVHNVHVNRCTIGSKSLYTTQFVRRMNDDTLLFWDGHFHRSAEAAAIQSRAAVGAALTKNRRITAWKSLSDATGVPYDRIVGANGNGSKWHDLA